MLKLLPPLLTAFFLLLVISLRGQLRPTSVPVNELTTDSYVASRILTSDGRFNPQASTPIWFNHKTVTPPRNLEQITEETPTVLGQSSTGKWIDVDLTTQRLTAYEGSTKVFEFPISSGLPWFPTVTGEFHIWAKLRSQEMIGGSKENGTYYDLPNVPFIQYFHKGFGIHGTYWHHDFGKPRSHGCINMRIEDARTLFFWTDPQLAPDQYAIFNIAPDVGTRVVVHGVTPINIY